MLIRYLLLIIVILVSILSHIGNSGNWLVIMLGSFKDLFHSENHSSRVILIFTFTFFMVISANLIGTFIYTQHILLTRLTLTLIRLVLILWIFSYRRYLKGGWKYLSNTLVVNIIYPSLSLLLRNIEILTHLFRPVTLIARIWVNMWVGHSILSILSFLYTKEVSVRQGLRSSILILPVTQGILFLYEIMIILLQSAVIVYLSFVYYKDNHRAITSTH